MTKIGGGALAGAGCVGAFMVMVACSSSQMSSSSGGTSGSSGDPVEGGTPTGDGGGGGDAVAGAKGGGQLSLYSAKTTSTFIAAFVPPAVDAGPLITPGCTIETVGACLLSYCSSTPEAGPPGPAIPTMEVGSITATGGLIQGAGLTLTPTGSAYEPKSSVGVLWTGGETLTFSATGGSGVAPFSVTAQTPPAALSIASPIVTSGSSLNIPRSADFVLQWGIGSTPPVGKVSLVLSTVGSSGPPKSLQCSFDVSALTGSIPTATLKRLDPGPGSLTFGVSATTSQTVSDVLVTVSLQTPATASGEELGFVNATLEE